MSRTIIIIWLFSFVSMSNLLASTKLMSDSITDHNCNEKLCISQEITDKLFPDLRSDFVVSASIDEIISEYISGNSKTALTLLKSEEKTQANKTQLNSQLKNIECAILINNGDFRRAAKEITALSVLADKQNNSCGKSFALIQLSRLFFLSGKAEIAQHILNLALQFAYITRCQQSKIDIYLLKAQIYNALGKTNKSNQALSQAKNILTFSNQTDGLLRYLVLYAPLANDHDTLITSAFENDLFLLQQKCNNVYLKTLIGQELIQKAIRSKRYNNANTLINQLLNRIEYSSEQYTLLKVQIQLSQIKSYIHQNNLIEAQTILNQVENLLSLYPDNLFNIEVNELKKELVSKFNDTEALIKLQEKENQTLNAQTDALSEQIFTTTNHFLRATLEKARKKNEEKEYKINTGIILAIILLIGFVVIGFLFSQHRTEQNFNSRHIELKQELLISQLSPKFSYRWLSGLKDMVKEREPDEAADYLSIFAKFTRTILHAPQNDFTPLRQELESIERYYWLLQQNTLIPIKLTINLPEDGAGLDITVPPFYSHIITEIILGSFLAQNKETFVQLDITESNTDLVLNYTIKTKDDSSVTVDNTTQQELLKAESMTNERLALLKKLHKREIRLKMKEEFDSKGQYNMIFRIAKLEKRDRHFRFLL